MKPVYVARDPHEKQLQRALMQFNAPRNYKLVHEALTRAGGRSDRLWPRLSDSACSLGKTGGRQSAENGTECKGRKQAVGEKQWELQVWKPLAKAHKGA